VTTGAMLWFLYFSLQTDWRPPIWPLRARMFSHVTLMLFLSWLVIWAICMGQTAILSFLSCGCCSKTLLEMKATDRSTDLMPSRSEDGWDELMKSGPKHGP
jgi:hypothetical protein